MLRFPSNYILFNCASTQSTYTYNFDQKGNIVYNKNWWLRFRRISALPLLLLKTVGVIIKQFILSPYQNNVAETNESLLSPLTLQLGNIIKFSDNVLSRLFHRKNTCTTSEHSHVTANNITWEALFKIQYLHKKHTSIANTIFSLSFRAYFCCISLRWSHPSGFRDNSNVFSMYHWEQTNFIYRFFLIKKGVMFEWRWMLYM